MICEDMTLDLTQLRARAETDGHAQGIFIVVDATGPRYWLTCELAHLESGTASHDDLIKRIWSPLGRSVENKLRALKDKGSRP